ncbi:MAG TPA: flagellar assembly protein FliH [Bacillaceae bacterium]
MSRLIKAAETTSSERIISLKEAVRNLSAASESLDLHKELAVKEALKQAEDQAEAIIARAQEEARTIQHHMDAERANWEEEKNILRKKAWETGYEEGLKEGHQQGLLTYEEQITAARDIVRDSREAFQQYLESAERTILELAVSVAEKVLHGTLQENPEQFHHLVKAALKEAREFKEVQIHVHPANHQALMAAKNELDALFPSNTQCFIYPDSDMDEHACVIESENGRIDASIGSQLSELKSKLLELLEGQR